MPTPAEVVVLDGTSGTLSLEEVELPDPRSFEVVVKLAYSGLCHSQLHTISARPPGPRLLGHEASGVVTKIGNSVTDFSEGDRVIVTWLPRRGDMPRRPPESVGIVLASGAVATPATAGVFAWGTHTVLDEQFLVKAPPGALLDLASVIGCAVMTGAGAVLHNAKVSPGASVAVWGVGGVGLSAVAAARAAGAKVIVAVDLDDEKLRLARKFGATEVVNAASIDPVAAVRSLTPFPGGLSLGGTPAAGADYVFDCIGGQKSFDQSLAATRSGSHLPGGTVVMVGVPTAPFAFDMLDLVANEKTVRGCVGGSSSPKRDFPLFLKWHDEGQIDLAELVTARYPLRQVHKAVADLQGGQVLGRAVFDLN